MNICIFPGTFNPIHMAHIKMAQFALEKLGFEKIIFVPAYIPPHKEIDKSLAKHRFNMVKLATKNISKFEVSDFEYNSEGKSYTLLTVKQMIKQYKINGRLNLLIGTDAFKNVKMWYKANELKKLVHFIVFPRSGDEINENEFEGYSFELLNASKIDISSTNMREKHIGETTKEVEEYIKTNELYN